MPKASGAETEELLGSMPDQGDTQEADPQPVGDESASDLDEGDEPNSDGIDWGDVASELDAADDSDVESPVLEAEPESPADQEPEQPAAQPEPAPAPQEASPEPTTAQQPAPQPESAQPAVQSEPQQQQPAQQPPQAQQPPGPTQEQQEQHRQQLREQYLGQLEQRYQLTDEQTRELITDANTVLPQMMAALHSNVMEEALAGITQVMQQALPTYLQSWQTQQDSSRQAETEFFSQWDELRPYRDQVLQIANGYLNANPNVDRKQFMRDVGIQAWMIAGLPINQLASKVDPPPAAQQPQQPRQPQAPQGYNPAPSSPARPAPANNLNPFEAMAEVWDNEEDF